MTPHQLGIDEALAELGTDRARGLSTEEARARLARYGQNELTTDERVPPWQRFLAQFRNVLVLLLLIATGISAGLWFFERESALPYEALAIFSVVLLNAIMGYIQEAKAEQAVTALRRLSAAQAHVIRDGVRTTVSASAVVPGDILLLEEGDTVPADGRLLESVALQMAEAALTGESVPVEKNTQPIPKHVPLGDRVNMVFSGTAATYGHGAALVVATGMQTQIGLIAGALKQAPDQGTPLQAELDKVGRRLGGTVVLIAIVMIGTIIVVEDVHGASALFDALILGVALAVAAVPEGLPAVVTAVLALGVQRMAERKAIVRKLAAVEALGSASVIASDKTGTLTKNEMTVRSVVTASARLRFEGTGYTPAGAIVREDGGALDDTQQSELEAVLTAAQCANNAVLEQHDERWRVQGDPTEGALIVAARKAGFHEEALHARYRRVGEVPFSSERKLMSTLHTDEPAGRLLLFVKGAPDVLLPRCTSEVAGAGFRPLDPARRAQISESNEALAREGQRTLAVALRILPVNDVSQVSIDARLEHELSFAGLVGMIDPPRAEAKQAVARAKAAGVRTLMITGDHPVTAGVIATELGISTDLHVLRGTDLENMSDADLVTAVQRASVYARVDPEHKLRIVKALQQNGAVVAMTGDGVNDAPALKTADIGVAMGITGTDVSKEAADIVLADDNFATIVAAVEEGRAIFANIRKFLRYLLSSNIGEVLTMFFGVLLAQVLGLPLEHGSVTMPLLATQLLWVNLVTDGAPALALGLDPGDPGVMNAPPRSSGESVITRSMWFGIVFVGAIMATGSLLVLDASLPGGLIEGSGTLRYGQTMAFTTIVCFSLFAVWGARSDERSAFIGMFSNRWLWAAVLLALALQCAVVYLPPLQRAFGTVPLTAADWVRCLLVASSVLWLRELSKLVRRRSPTALGDRPRA